MVWSTAQSPLDPPDWLGPATVHRVDGALLTPFDRGPLNTVDRPRMWMTGAVHDRDGALVVASQRTWSAANPSVPVAADPRSITPPGRPHHLDGAWLYVGHWTGHFGHFLTEVLPNLWPQPDAHPVRGLVAHRSMRGAVDASVPLRMREAELASWQAELIALAGYPSAVKVVRSRPSTVETLWVASRPVLFRAWALPEAVEVWERVAERIGTGSTEPLVFMSRRLFNQTRDAVTINRTTASWDADLERVFAAAGFAVVHPERLSVTEQVRLVRGATVLAGSSGSALHLSAFARSGTRVLEVGDARATAPETSQQMIDSARGHRTAFVPHGDLTVLERVLAGVLEGV